LLTLDIPLAMNPKALAVAAHNETKSALIRARQHGQLRTVGLLYPMWAVNPHMGSHCFELLTQ